MVRSIYPSVAVLTSRGILAAFFLWAACAKATMTAGGPSIYEHWLEQYPSIRYALPVVEAGLGIWLLLGFFPRAAALSSIALVSGFSGLLLLEIFRHHPKPCGCMGAVAALYEPSAIRWSLAVGLGRNAMTIAGCAYLYLRAGSTPAGSEPVAVNPGADPVPT